MVSISRRTARLTIARLAILAAAPTLCLAGCVAVGPSPYGGGYAAPAADAQVYAPPSPSYATPAYPAPVYPAPAYAAPVYAPPAYDPGVAVVDPGPTVYVAPGYSRGYAPPYRRDDAPRGGGYPGARPAPALPVAPVRVDDGRGAGRPPGPPPVPRAVAPRPEPRGPGAAPPGRDLPERG